MSSLLIRETAEKLLAMPDETLGNVNFMALASTGDDQAIKVWAFHETVQYWLQIALGFVAWAETSPNVRSWQLTVMVSGHFVEVSKDLEVTDQATIECN